MSRFQRVLRILRSLFQFKSLRAAPKNMSGKNVLLTGGARGIGAEVCRSLALWGAHVLLSCRNREQGEKLKKEILEQKPDAKITLLDNADTSDLDSMKALADKVESILGEEPLDGLILNAGIAGGVYKTSPQGYEMQVATNVLGHHMLVHKLINRLKRSESARIVYVTGDIYVLADNCSLNYQYPPKLANYAYARSKLGVSWNALSMHEHMKENNLPITIASVHPGVVNSGLVNQGGLLKKLFLISPEKSAGSVLFALTDASVKSGDYFHNDRGKMHLPENDPVSQLEKRRAFWLSCQQACEL